ncbi:hypothetical protein KOW79_017456 [Hemibagrus wyckioides]|uniref:Uncharacterized protein n=1 Tax=Hemibagrus wyckioides TaxID=337641 RepID=A0A9D3SCG2_9TELE|nr:hypothetical protein KOW79_017456 [Hemibagrus wyckioides]
MDGWMDIDNNNPCITTKALIDTLNQAGESVSRSTVQRILHQGSVIVHRHTSQPTPTDRVPSLQARTMAAK